MDSLLVFDKYDGSINPRVIDYFGVDTPEEVVWSHRTNTQDLLDKEENDIFLCFTSSETALKRSG